MKDPVMKASGLFDVLFGEEDEWYGVVEFVVNKKKHHRAAGYYWRILVEMQGREQTLLFTTHEMRCALRRAARNPEDADRKMDRLEAKAAKAKAKHLKWQKN
jgi:hypothetical protein